MKNKQQDNRPELAGLLPEEIEPILLSLGEPRYRALQVFQWIQKRRVTQFDSMSNLPHALRVALAEKCRVGIPVLREEFSVEKGGSGKYLLRLSDGIEIETVRIPAVDGPTICVSSQAGCAYDCAFCATAIGGLQRSLRAGEIVGQILALTETPKRVVYMGMGEPLANFKSVLQSVRILTHPEGAAIPPRRITISTVGLVPMIDRLARENLGVRLAISLTSAIDEKRDRLMPVNRKFPLPDLLGSASRFASITGSRVTFEYPLMGGVNDGEEDVRALVDRLGPLRCRLNLIPFNQVEELDFEAPPESRVEHFLKKLTPYLNVTVRRSAGREIDAACGQLRIRAQKREEPDAS